jgi:hypothetical protein
MTATVRKGTKKAKVLRTFVERGKRGLNCFEAVTLCRDYVLRSSVSDLQKTLGLKFTRKFEQVGEFKTLCVRYSLDGEERAKAAKLLRGEEA